MVKIDFEFCKRYEPGELAEDQDTVENRKRVYLPSTPRFKDRVKSDGKEYIVWDVVYDADNEGNEPDPKPIFVRAIRKVTYPPKDDERR